MNLKEILKREIEDWTGSMEDNRKAGRICPELVADAHIHELQRWLNSLDDPSTNS